MLGVFFRGPLDQILKVTTEIHVYQQITQGYHNPAEYESFVRSRLAGLKTWKAFLNTRQVSSDGQIEFEWIDLVDFHQGTNVIDKDVDGDIQPHIVLRTLQEILKNNAFRNQGLRFDKHVA